MRRAGRIDDNQGRIVAVLRKVGASVAITSGAGDGLPDLLVGWMGETYLLEVKDGRKAPSAKKLTPAERYFVETWRGRPVVIVESEADALRALLTASPGGAASVSSAPQLKAVIFKCIKFLLIA